MPPFMEVTYPGKWRLSVNGVTIYFGRLDQFRSLNQWAKTLLSGCYLYVKENTWAGNQNRASWNQDEGAWDWSQLSALNWWEILLPR